MLCWCPPDRRPPSRRRSRRSRPTRIAGDGWASGAGRSSSSVSRWIGALAGWWSSSSASHRRVGGHEKILHVVASRQRRGAEVFASSLVAALDRDGIEQRVAVLRAKGSDGVGFAVPTATLGDGKGMLPGPAPRGRCRVASPAADPQLPSGCDPGARRRAPEVRGCVDRRSWPPGRVSEDR